MKGKYIHAYIYNNKEKDEGEIVIVILAVDAADVFLAYFLQLNTFFGLLDTHFYFFPRNHFKNNLASK